MGLHNLLSKVTGIEELELTEDESVTLCQSMNDVIEQYDLTLDPRTAAWVNLGIAATMIYGPRVLAIKWRIEEARARQHQKRTEDTIRAAEHIVRTGEPERNGSAPILDLPQTGGGGDVIGGNA